jgi:hypothetical protein
MKRTITILFLALALSVTGHAAYSEGLIYVLEQLRHCRFLATEETPMVGGRAIGYAGTPHEFYLLFPYVSHIATEQDLAAMLQDKSPVVRIMGAKCVLKRRWFQFPKPSVEELLKDGVQVFVAPSGCMISKRTVGAVIAELKRNPDFLGDEKPPISPEPTSSTSSRQTPTTVTPPAGQEARQP